jgi:hypothetical protein
MNTPFAPVEVRVTTDSVLEAIDNLDILSFTTFEVAMAMRVDEYPVRAAVSWLLKFGAIRRCGARKCMTKPVRRERNRYEPGKCEPYWANTYERVMSNNVDFAELNRIFCGAGR